MRVAGQDRRNAGISAGERFEASGHCPAPEVRQHLVDHDRKTIMSTSRQRSKEKAPMIKPASHKVETEEA
ncbi:hypothetical protein HAX54_007636 [Datura stramonium]|uniref:Uncharacterized protein n=1 Tax=Datura stramonium TaxID=4076 RepID=A0ABS8TD21_DATST|nr:hypothetical protein [Datura stramonium]